MTGYFDKYAADYDRIQPVKIEMYRFYHELALDLIPFEPEDTFSVVDLGCGTGEFLAMLLKRFTNAEAIGLDISAEMLEVAAKKISHAGDRVRFQQHDLNEVTSGEPGQTDLVVAFSALHHLPDERKRTIYEEIFSLLRPNGHLFLADAMFVPYDSDLWRLGRKREVNQRIKRLEESGVGQAGYESYEEIKRSLDATSPERDRISSLESQLEYLRNAGFSSIDRIWHFWMEHLVIARK